MNGENRNKGFSLIEIIVVIALMAVVTGGSMSVYSWTKSNKLKEIAGNVNDCISETRSKTLTKSGTYELVIKKVGNDFVGEIYHGGSVVSQKKIAGSGSITAVAAGTTYSVQGGTEIHIAFNKSDGSFSKMEIGGVTIDGSITVTRGDRSKVIKLIRLTGKHYID